MRVCCLELRCVSQQDGTYTLRLRHQDTGCVMFGNLLVSTSLRNLCTSGRAKHSPLEAPRSDKRKHNTCEGLCKPVVQVICYCDGLGDPPFLLHFGGSFQALLGGVNATGTHAS